MGGENLTINENKTQQRCVTPRKTAKETGVLRILQIIPPQQIISIPTACLMNQINTSMPSNIYYQFFNKKQSSGTIYNNLTNKQKISVLSNSREGGTSN